MKGMENSMKSWGTKISLFQNDLCEVSMLHLNGGQRCSWHRHRAKWNQFYVIDGELEVVVEELGQRQTAKITRGQIFTTNPGQWHEFRTPSGPAVVQEIMYVRYEAGDIEREQVGGLLRPVKGSIEEATEPY